MKRILSLTLTGLLACTTSVYCDSLFTAKVAERGTLAAPKRQKFEEGDIVMVIVREAIDALTQADTDTRKESEIVAEAPAAANTFLVAERPGGLNITSEERLPNWDINVENEFRTEGTTRRRNTLTMTVACRVVHVDEHGNIHLEGAKRVTVNREDSKVVVSGMARTKDVTFDNTVLSTQLADAVVELKGGGPLWNNQRRGILTKVLDWFSPF